MNDAYVCRRCNYNQFIGGPCYSCGSFDVMQSSLSSKEMLGAIDELFRRLEIEPVDETGSVEKEADAEPVVS